LNNFINLQNSVEKKVKFSIDLDRAVLIFVSSEQICSQSKSTKNIDLKKDEKAKLVSEITKQKKMK